MRGRDDFYQADAFELCCNVSNEHQELRNGGSGVVTEPTDYDEVVWWFGSFDAMIPQKRRPKRGEMSLKRGVIDVRQD